MLDNYGINNWQLLLDCLLIDFVQAGKLTAFNKLSNKNKIKYCYTNKIINGRLTAFIEAVKQQQRFEKSTQISKEYRERGNKAFAKNELSQALDFYTKSILYAPVTSKEHALSLGNRSAALFLKGNFQACVLDIDSAMNITCKNQIVEDDKLYEVKLLVRKVKAQLKLGQEDGKQTLSRAYELIQDLNNKSFQNDKLNKLKKEVDGILEAINEDIKLKNDQMKYECCVENYLANIQSQFGENPQLKYTSNKIELKETEEKGRHIIAKDDVFCGDVLFIEAPFAFVTLPDPQHTVCQNCCQTDLDNPVGCDKCAEGSYCSEICKNEANKSFHYLECGFGLDILYSIGLAHLSLRLAIYGRDKTKQDEYERVKGLLSNLDKIEVEDFFLYSLTATLLLIYLKNHTGFFKKESIEEQYEFGAAILEHLGQLICNGHAIVSYSMSHRNNSPIAAEEQRRIGTGIFPSVSMMNHGCDPSVNASFVKSLLIVKSVKDLKKGEEVYNCYGPNFRRMTTKERKEALLDQYHFSCRCNACQSPTEFCTQFNKLWCTFCKSEINLETFKCTYCLTEFDVLKKQLSNLDMLKKEAECLINRDECEKALDILKNISSNLSCYVKNCNKELMEINDIKAVAFCKLCKWDQSFLSIERSLYFVKQIYGEMSLEVANEIVKLSDVAIEIISNKVLLKNNVSMLQRCLVYCKTALNIYNLYYGPYLKKYIDLQEKILILQNNC
ncbi:SET and MYND domain-containing protein 4-like [Cimex lectularius]|uniref:SET domain-containing protein n=1 Tax=Cimex lectularius TaxID=79782 RepID=A0A8I6TB20_CIMLE|nr:SET and MYND domain-containing protein 4-like [Cimex lectularius]